MSNVKEQLDELLRVIDKLCEQQEYAWFKKELQKRFGGNKSAVETSLALSSDDKDDMIKAIYEYCIHELLRNQADTFFVDLPFPKNVMESIKNAYIMMEKSKLNNDFDGFSFYLHKQIDLIFGYIIKNTDFEKIIKPFYSQPHYINTIKGVDNQGKYLYKSKEDYNNTPLVLRLTL